MSTGREYLGDGVYVRHDGFAIVLTTENGVSTTNEIVLEPEVFTALLEWHRRLARREARS